METVRIARVVREATDPKPANVRRLLEFSGEEIGEAMYELMVSNESFRECMGEALKKAYYRAVTEEENKAMDRILEAFTDKDIRGFVRYLQKRR